MRNTYTLLGFSLLLIIVIAIYAFNQDFTKPADTERITGSPPSMESTLTLTSPAFEHNGKIPSKFTCDAKEPDRQVNPMLSISGVPAGAKSLALIMDDPDVPKALKPDGVFDHWTLFNLPAGRETLIEEGKVPEGAVVGANGAGKSAYVGPCPPPQYEPSEHRYFFRLYALDTMLDLPEGASKTDVLRTMQGHILAQTELIGKYRRVSQ